MPFSLLNAQIHGGDRSQGPDVPTGRKTATPCLKAHVVTRKRSCCGNKQSAGVGAPCVTITSSLRLWRSASMFCSSPSQSCLSAEAQVLGHCTAWCDCQRSNERATSVPHLDWHGRKMERGTRHQDPTYGGQQMHAPYNRLAPNKWPNRSISKGEPGNL
jgi:hypothetical protein